ncbi:MAG: DciA family protein [Dermatophilaceae bacterium]
MKPARRRRNVEATFSGTDRGGRDPALLGEQLERLLADQGWGIDVAVGSVTGRWADIVGADIATHVAPVGFVDGVLTVRADSSAWATQMRLLSARLLERLADEVGTDAVTELVVRGPGAPRWTHGQRRVAGRGPRDTYG